MVVLGAAVVVVFGASVVVESFNSAPTSVSIEALPDGPASLLPLPHPVRVIAAAIVVNEIISFSAKATRPIVEVEVCS